TGTGRNKLVAGHVITRRALKPDAAVRHAANNIVDDADIARLTGDVDAGCDSSIHCRLQFAADDRVVPDHHRSKVTSAGRILYQNAIPVQKGRAPRVNDVVGDFYVLRDIARIVGFHVNWRHTLLRTAPRILKSVAIDHHVATVHDGRGLTGD